MIGYARIDSYLQAARKNRIVVKPRKNELFIDIDNEESRVIFDRNIKILEQAIDCTYEIKPSPSGDPDKAHVYVRLARPIKDKFERIMLQSMLGSDLVHEMISWFNATQGGETPTVFFENRQVKT
jgi:hypothetical protein